MFLGASAGHTHASIDQRFSRISNWLRKLDCFIPSGLGRFLEPLFESSEPLRCYKYMPGWNGVDPTELANAVCGPGDFAAAFKQFVNRFDGLGSEQGQFKRRCVRSIRR